MWDFDKHMDIYRVKLDGTGMTKLTDKPGYDAEGSYSSDGKQIVFTSDRDGDPDLYIMDADGKNVPSADQRRRLRRWPVFLT